MLAHAQHTVLLAKKANEQKNIYTFEAIFKSCTKRTERKDNFSIFSVKCCASVTIKSLNPPPQEEMKKGLSIFNINILYDDYVVTKLLSSFAILAYSIFRCEERDNSFKYSFH